MKIGNTEFQQPNHTYVMGILNLTPDSFSDGGKYNEQDAALAHVDKMLEEGMDILDIGGESTRPGYTRLSEEEEIRRVVPVIEAVRKRFAIPISLDTYKSKVAEAGLLSGADLINDIWGLQGDEKIADVIARHKAACVLMHNRKDGTYGNFMEDVVSDLKRTTALAKQAGITEDKIILDPGVGFAKDCNQNLQVINQLEKITALGYPVLLAASRKSVIGLTLKLPVEERLEGTLATTALAVMKSCQFVRVHDVKENVRVIKMLEAILDSGRGGQNGSD